MDASQAIFDPAGVRSVTTHIRDRVLRLILLGVSLCVVGCGARAGFESEPLDCKSPPKSDIDSVQAWEQAQCLLASQPELGLVVMRTAPTYSGSLEYPYSGSLDGRGGWLFHFVSPADPSMRIVVEITTAQVVTTNEARDPCPAAITPFDSVRVVEELAPSLPPGFEDDSLLMARSLCPEYDWLHGLTVASVANDESLRYYHGLFDESEELVTACGPCESALPDECGCITN